MGAIDRLEYVSGLLKGNMRAGKIQGKCRAGEYLPWSGRLRCMDGIEVDGLIHQRRTRAHGGSQRIGTPVELIDPGDVERGIRADRIDIDQIGADGSGDGCSASIGDRPDFMEHQVKLGLDIIILGCHVDITTGLDGLDNGGRCQILWAAVVGVGFLLGIPANFISQPQWAECRSGEYVGFTGDADFRCTWNRLRANPDLSWCCAGK